MSRFLHGALVMGAVFALASFASRLPVDPAVKPTGGPAWNVSQYQLDRAFRTPVPLQNPVSFQMPSNLGVIVTQLHPQGGVGATLSVTVNGVSEDFAMTASDVRDLNPPIIARPGDILTFALTGGAGSAGVVVAGYTTLPGET